MKKENISVLRRFIFSIWVVVIAQLVTVQGSLADSTPELWAIWNKSDSSNTATIDHSAWQQLLQRYLISNHESGVNRFRYSDVSEEDADSLENYLDTLQSIDPRDYNSAEQQAYWINLYNALTVQVILEEKPFFSILETSQSLLGVGPWDDELAEIAGQAVTLNDIEHRILRPIWKDARIHFAVNCASIGCPNLQPQAFTAENTEQLLSSGARQFIAHSRGVNFDRKGRLELSKIFLWYSEDFGSSQQTVLKSISQFASPDLARRLQNYQGDIEYQYSWKLNRP